MTNETYKVVFNTRTRNLVAKDIVLGVENDLGNEVLMFDCPATYNGLRLKNFEVRIKYLNAKGQRGFVIPADITEDGDRLTFTWSPSEHVCRYHGYVRFNITFELLEGTEIIQQLSSRIAKAKVAHGIEVAEMPDDQELHDLIEAVFGKIEPYIDDKVAAAASEIAKTTITEADSDTLLIEVTQLEKGKKLDINADTATRNEISRVLF